MNDKHTVKSDTSLPVLALRDQVMLPNVFLSLTIGREISINSIMHAMHKTNNQIILVAQKDMDVECPSPAKDLYTVGTLCNIRQVTEIIGNAYKVYIEGIARVSITEWDEQDNIILCNFNSIESNVADTIQSNAHVKTVIGSFAEYIRLKGYTQDAFSYISKISEQHVVANLIANNIQMPHKVKQEFLEEKDFIKQLEMLLAKIDYENVILTIEKQLKTKSSEAQKERLLEQINTIQNKLVGGMSDTDDFTQRKQEKGKFPNEALEREYEKAFDTLRRTSKYSPEYDTLRTYIDTLLRLPTQNASINNDVDAVLKKFSESISGQDKIKELIAEQIAVMGRNRRMTNNGKPSQQIICFSGAPGVGKTSMAKAITEALVDLNTKGPKLQLFTIALGGLRDEAGLKGHRRTYVGSMCGQIIEGFMRTGITNPVILLDEIDKIGGGDRGNPEGILLALLDRAQNSEFVDNYINAPFDVSKALFIATANDPSAIHPALRDRLYMIEIPPYTVEDKITIAQKQMWPSIAVSKCIEKQVSISAKAIRQIITDYTYEAGVRSLYKLLDSIASKIVKMFETNKTTKDSLTKDSLYKVTIKTLSKLLGPKLVLSQELQDNTPGVINGLSVSMVGGSTLMVEAVVYNGNGSKQITGMAEKVMRESVDIALTGIQRIASTTQIYDANKNLIDSTFFTKHNFHIHFNEGAVPKDGPSAGITSFIALLSAITGIAPRHRIAMTGELTLTGLISGVGGITEKLMAAYISQCTCVFIPMSNIQNLQKIQKQSMHPLTQTLVAFLDKHNYDMHSKQVQQHLQEYKNTVRQLLDKIHADNISKITSNDEPEHEDFCSSVIEDSVEQELEDASDTASKSSHKNSTRSEYEGLIIVPSSHAVEVLDFALGLKVN